jgi:hypothetical protein
MELDSKSSLLWKAIEPSIWQTQLLMETTISEFKTTTHTMSNNGGYSTGEQGQSEAQVTES